jgi:hypothetical protein
VGVEAGVCVAVGVSVNAGVGVVSGANAEQDEIKNIKTKRTDGRVWVLFCMGCILPLVVKITASFHEKIRMEGNLLKNILPPNNARREDTGFRYN